MLYYTKTILGKHNYEYDSIYILFFIMLFNCDPVDQPFGICIVSDPHYLLRQAYIKSTWERYWSQQAMYICICVPVFQFILSM